MPIRDLYRRNTAASPIGPGEDLPYIAHVNDKKQQARSRI